MTSLKHFILFALFFFLAEPLFSAHIVGGGITYECLGNTGNGMRYRFTMKVYRDCASGGAQFDNPANIAIYNGSYLVNSLFSNFTVNLSSSQFIGVNEPDCIDNLPSVCLQEGTYIWERILPISNESYFIVYQRCCRINAITNILLPGETGATYYTEITSAAQFSCNNSPVFNNFPPVVICNNYPLQVDYSATDAEGDQLVYSFCAPFAGGGNILTFPGSSSCNGVVPNPPCSPPFTEVTFVGAFSPGQPMGGNPVISIHPQTGIISGTPQLNGIFVVGVCIEEYRNGQLMSVTRRDFQFIVAPCAPQVTAFVAHDELPAPKQYVIKKCSGTTNVSIVNQSLPVANINGFEWIFDLGSGNILYNNTDFDLNIDFPDFGVYNGFLVLNPGLDCGDTAFIRVELYEPAALELGPDIMICQDGGFVFDAGPDFAQYVWQDGSTSQNFSATTIGIYHVAATDNCGNVLRDTVVISGGMAPDIILSDTIICPGDSILFEVPGFVQYEWSPSAGLNCTDCGSVIASPTVSTVYSVMATTQDGCTATGTVTVDMLPTPMQTYVIQFYPNESVTIGGQTYTQSTTVTLSVPSNTGDCDSLNTYILERLETTLQLECSPDLTVALPSGATSVVVDYAQPTVTTDCPGTAPVVTQFEGPPSGTPFPPGIKTVCFEATNTCDNRDTCCFTVTVTSLDLQCPANLTVALPNNATTVPVNYAAPTANSDCPGSTPDIQLTQGIPSGGAFPLGLSTVCFEATTSCGNQDACCFTVMVTTLDIVCPGNITVELPSAATTIAVNYALPTTTSNCPDPNVNLTLVQGQPSGGSFAQGVHPVCYEADNNCGNLNSCCFNITVLEPPSPCDIKNIGCMRFELLDIRLDSINQRRFRIRATNFCASEVDYILNQLPPGVIAVTPQNGTVYTAPNTGNTYLVRNPNASPFYSVRFRSISPGLNNGQSDVFEHRLPQQSHHNNYIHMFARLKNGQGFEAYLNTFYCPVQPWAGERPNGDLDARNTALVQAATPLFPNPSSGTVMVDMLAWMGQKAQIRVFNSLGQQVLVQNHTIDSEWIELTMDTGLANGLYHLVVQPEDGEKATARFVLER